MDRESISLDLRSLAGGLRTTVRGCRQHAPEDADRLNEWLDRRAADLERFADAIASGAALKRLDAKRATLRDAMRRAEEAEGKVAPLKAESVKLRKRVGELEKDLKAVKARAAELHTANLARPEVKPLVAALLQFMIFQIRLVPEDEADRLRIVATMDAAQMALRAVGSAADFPTVHYAYRQALAQHGYA